MMFQSFKAHTDPLTRLSDSYKYTHAPQYEKGTTEVHAYHESRGGIYPVSVFNGLQYPLKAIFCQRITPGDVTEARDMANQHFGRDLFNLDGWNHIVNNLGGRWPIEVHAMPEGSVVPIHNALMYIKNTDPKSYWATNFSETLLVQDWYPTTVATLSRHALRVIRKYRTLTGGLGGLQFALHDFGFRGASSVETAKIGGTSHLMNFMGTDTFPALFHAKDYYGAKSAAGFSIPASEHSTITSWKRSREYLAFLNMLEQYPEGLVACVSDSYDLMAACDAWGSDPLKSLILARPGTLVVRPDSGDPVTTVLATIERLGSKFGFTTNVEGYKELPPQIRIIQGDGVNPDSIEQILIALMNAGWSAGNIAFGMGGALLQQVNRDTQKNAFKCCYTVVNGEERDVFKDPVTDTGKRSKAGRLKVIEPKSGVRMTVRMDDPAYAQYENQMRMVFKNGELLIDYNLDQIRTRIDAEEKVFWK